MPYSHGSLNQAPTNVRSRVVEAVVKSCLTRVSLAQTPHGRVLTSCSHSDGVTGCFWVAKIKG